MPKQYRKKPVIVEAVQVDSSEYDFQGILDWCEGTFIDFDDYVLEIYTLEGTMRAQDGDWIIKGVQGEFYPCKPDIFEATYELVEPGTASGLVE